MNRPPNQILEETFRQCCDMDASLNERLARFAAVSRELNPAYANLIDQLVERIESNQAGTIGPQPGDPMPPFVLTDQTGRMVSLDDVIRDGPVALIFHRGHWCPYCRINTKTLAQAYPRIRQAGGKIVAVMPDRQQYTAQMIEDLDLPFPILTDLDNGYLAGRRAARFLRKPWPRPPGLPGQRLMGRADPRNLRSGYRRARARALY